MKLYRIIPLLGLFATLSLACMPVTSPVDDAGGTLSEKENNEEDEEEEEEETALAQVGEVCETDADCEMGDCLDILSDFGFKGMLLNKVTIGAVKLDLASSCTRFRSDKDKAITFSMEKLRMVN